METTNTIQLVDKYGEKVTDAIKVIAEKLGQSVDHFYPVFVKQQVIEGISFFALVGLVWVIGGIALFVTRKQTLSDKDGNPTMRAIVLIVVGILFLFTLMPVAMEGSNHIGKIFNPEYAAIQEIIKMVR